MCDYATEAADWSTELPHLDFAVSERERREEWRGEGERNREGKERGMEGIKCVM